MPVAKNWSPEEKAKVVSEVSQLMEEGTSTVEACKKKGIHISSFYAWRKKQNPTKKRTAQAPSHMTVHVAPPKRDETITLIQGRTEDVLEALRLLNKQGR